MIPQIIMLSLIAISLLISANKHGQLKKGRESFWISVLSIAIGQSLLYWGGFYDVLMK